MAANREKAKRAKDALRVREQQREEEEIRQKEAEELATDVCCYCGKKLPEHPVEAQLHTRTQPVCSEACKQKTEEYLRKDKKYKTWLYALVFLGGIGFIISAVFGTGDYKMVGAYLGQIVAGAAFVLFPYPVTAFRTFQSTCIVRVTLISRIVGAVLAVSGVALLAAQLMGIG